MLNQWHSTKKLNKFRLAVFLLAGIFSFSAFPVKAAEYNSVSSGDASNIAYSMIKENGFSSYDEFLVSSEDYGIMPLAASSYTIAFPKQQTFLNKNYQTYITSTYNFDLGALETGFYSISVSFKPSFTFKDNQGKTYNDLSIDVQWFLISGGEKIYPTRSTDSSFTFQCNVDLTRIRYLAIGYEGYISRGSIYDDMYVSIDCTLNTTSNFGFTRYYDSEISSLNNIAANTANINSNLIAKLDTANSNLSDIANRISLVWNEQQTYFSAWFTEIFNKLKELHNDNTNFKSLFNTFSSNLTSNLTTWFDRNHTDLETLHTDNTTFLARFNTVYNDLKNKLSEWFNRQHQDFLDLIESLTNGYDNSAGEAENDKLSGALGGMDEAEGQITDSASVELDKFDASESFQFGQATLSALSFVKSFIDSFIVASGSFSLLVTLYYTMFFLSLVVGLWRFMR